MIRIVCMICNALREASMSEWLETNGLGSFASSAVAGINAPALLDEVF